MDMRTEKKVDPYCRKCIYYMRTGADYTCDYIFMMDKKRPCPPSKGCTERINKGTKKARELDALSSVQE